MNTGPIKNLIQDAFIQPRLPMAVEEILSLVNNPKTSVARLTNALLKERTLVESVLRKANSSFYGFSKRVNNINLAVALLGFDVLKETVTRVLIGSAIRKMVDVIYRYDDFWNHSIACGVIAGRLAKEFNFCHPDDAFVAALLDVMGHLALYQYLNENPQWHAIAASTVGMRGANLDEEVFGISHAEIGGLMAERWLLPEPIVDAIRYHHRPDHSIVVPALTATVHVADILSQRLNVGVFQEDSAGQFNRYALDLLNLDENTLTSEMMQEFATIVKDDLARSPAFETLVSQLKQTLISSIDQLPEKQKLILALHYYESLSFKEIGQVFEISESSARELHDEALARLNFVVKNSL